MSKALVRTALLVAAVLLLAPVIPFVADHEAAFLIAAVALGLVGVIGRLFIALIIGVAVLVLFHPFF